MKIRKLEDWESFEDCELNCSPTHCRFYGDEKKCPAGIASRMTVKTLNFLAKSDSFKEMFDQEVESLKHQRRFEGVSVSRPRDTGGPKV